MSLENKIKYQKRYKMRGCTKDQLKRIVELGGLNAEEYKEITGEDFEQTVIGGE